MKNKKTQAFTLAEILVTLMIIGVIAAITIPSLSLSTRNNEYVSGCLKAYSVLNQAIDRMKPEFGPVGIGAKWNNQTEFWNNFTLQLNTNKVCAKNAKGCNWSGIPKYLNGAQYAKSYDGWEYNLITNDGMTYNFLPGKTCSTDKGLSTKRQANSIGRFLVDVNGFKGPNRFGYDMFFFCLVKGEGIIPAGTDNNSADCTKASSGVTCAAKVINEKKIVIK